MYVSTEQMNCFTTLNMHKLNMDMREVTLRNSAYSSVPPVKLRVPRLFACSQRIPLHVTSLTLDLSVSVLFPRYKGQI